MENGGKYNGKCADYCGAQGLECLAQEKGQGDSCQVAGGWSGSCDIAGKNSGHTTSDLLCTCKEHAPVQVSDARAGAKGEGRR